MGESPSFLMMGMGTVDDYHGFEIALVLIWFLAFVISPLLWISVLPFKRYYLKKLK